MLTTVLPMFADINIGPVIGTALASGWCKIVKVELVITPKPTPTPPAGLDNESVAVRLTVFRALNGKETRMVLLDSPALNDTVGLTFK